MVRPIDRGMLTGIEHFIHRFAGTEAEAAIEPDGAGVLGGHFEDGVLQAKAAKPV